VTRLIRGRADQVKTEGSRGGNAEHIARLNRIVKASKREDRKRGSDD
jgi:hypothetical protein